MNLWSTRNMSSLGESKDQKRSYDDIDEKMVSAST